MLTLLLVRLLLLVLVREPGADEVGIAPAIGLTEICRVMNSGFRSYVVVFLLMSLLSLLCLLLLSLLLPTL